MPVYTHTLVQTIEGMTVSRAVTADGEGGRLVSLTALQANKEVDVDFVHTAIKGFYLKCTGPLTLKTNSSGSPVQTISYPAGGDAWLSGGIHVNPFLAGGADVTKIFLTDTSNAVNEVEIQWLVDATP